MALIALLRSAPLTLSDGRQAVVRSAAPSDAKAITRLLDEVASEADSGLLLIPGEVAWRDWRRRIKDALVDSRSLLLVAVVDGVVAGNLALRPDPHPRSPHVRTMGMSVAAGYRRLGIARGLIEAAATWARREGVVKLELTVFPYNDAAVALYESSGFVREGLLRAQFALADGFVDALTMARFLADPPPATRPTSAAGPASPGPGAG